MKQRHICPKCAGRKIWILERFRVPGESVEGRPLAVHQEEAAGGLFALERVVPRGHFDMFLCDGCGYSELWADGFRGLKPDPARGVRLLDPGDTSEGPFR